MNLLCAPISKLWFLFMYPKSKFNFEISLFDSSFLEPSNQSGLTFLLIYTLNFYIFCFFIFKILWVFEASLIKVFLWDSSDLKIWKTCNDIDQLRFITTINNTFNNRIYKILPTSDSLSPFVLIINNTLSQFSAKILYRENLSIEIWQ